MSVWGSRLKRFWHNFSRLQFDQIIKDIGSWWFYRHDAYREVLTYNDTDNRYRLDITTITAREFVERDLKISGAKYRRFFTSLTAPIRQETRIEEIDGVQYEFLNTSAVSNYLWMINNDVNECITGDFKTRAINPLILLGLVGVAVVIMIYFLFLKG